MILFVALNSKVTEEDNDQLIKSCLPKDTDFLLCPMLLLRNLHRKECKFLFMLCGFYQRPKSIERTVNST